jgi:hypothetical protein
VTFRLSNFGVRGMVAFIIALVFMTGATAIPGTPMYENDWGDTSCGGGEI